ncbi:MAG: LysM domain-containing protein [Lentisphaeria bacterium]|jgi:LysM repeat protein|nr:LysM domain-containing protein [Lentisphaeria bacterium]MDP7742116.1 LysM domain-containing protein [Lentisphaeria bacterium]
MRKQHPLTRPRFLVCLAVVVVFHVVVAIVCFQIYQARRTTQITPANPALPKSAPAQTREFVLEPAGNSDRPETAATRTHVVKNGENFTVIARKYGLTPSRLMSANGYTSGQVLPAGASLKIPDG